MKRSISTTRVESSSQRMLCRRDGTLSRHLSVEVTASISSGRVASSLGIVLSHANGLCKEIWRPMLRYLFSTLSMRYDVIIATAWDGFMAGDSAALNGHLLRDAISNTPHTLLDWADHAHDLVFISQWARQELIEKTYCSGAGAGAHITMLGIGHSLGGFATLRAEELVPGLFDTIAVMEPILFPPYFPRDPNPMQPGALRRRNVFKSRAEAMEYFQSKPFFSSWSEEALSLYVAFGLAENPESSSFELKCAPTSEAAVFANKADSPANIKAFEGLRNIVCPVLVLAGEDSGFAVLGPDPHTRLEQVLVVEMQSSRHSTFTLVPGVGHMLVVEAPERTARAVAEWLMSPTATTSNSSKI